MTAGPQLSSFAARGAARQAGEHGPVGQLVRAAAAWLARASWARATGCAGGLLGCGTRKEQAAVAADAGLGWIR
jgi:hypothetical protein